MNNFVYSIAIDEHDIKWFGVRENGLVRFDGETWTRYKLEPGVITAVEEEKAAPATIEFLPAYPNPFNPSTTINYGLPSESHVTIIIYDILGRKARTLVNNELYSAGLHSIFWDGKNDDREHVSSGIYLCRISTDSGVVTQKLLLAR